MVFVLIARIGNNLSALPRVFLKLEPPDRMNWGTLNIVCKVYDMGTELFIMVSEKFST